MEEAGAGHELAGALDLRGAQVDAGDLVAAGGQVPRQRHPTAAAQIQDGPAVRHPLPELGQPGGVPLRLLGVAPVAAGQRVVAAADDVLGIHSRRLQEATER